MPEFLELLPPSEALKVWLQHLEFSPLWENVDLLKALGRVSAHPVTAPHALPSFPRSTVDGYAVQAADTYGASDSLPAYLTLIGEVPMGKDSGITLGKAQCSLIHTGGLLPEGSNAVVMVENTQMARSDLVEVLRPAAPGENILKTGEDISPGEQVIPAGVPIRPAEIGGLAALGITHVSVAQQPRIAVISTGDEVIPVADSLQPGKVRDINTYSLSALVAANGGAAVSYGIIPDNPVQLAETASQALDETDMVIITAGSSASVRDLTADVINRLGEPGVIVHGVNVKPGKPTILGSCRTPQGQPKPVIGLPGNPVSALVIARLFVIPILQRLIGIRDATPAPSRTACLTINLPSQAGREDWTPVKLIHSQDGLLAEPIFGKSNLIFTLVRADGLIKTPAAATGLSAGEMVEVYSL